MDDEDDIDHEVSAGRLSIRVGRDQEVEVSYDGGPIPVTSIDIDDVSLERLVSQPRTLRDQ